MSRVALRGGGIDGNERLTTQTGLILILMLAALGVTIVLIGRLVWEHLFIGLLLIGPVLLKLASTGYRFVGYYAGSPAYVLRGPPWTPLRLIAPLVVISTVVVFGTGIVLLFLGPSDEGPWLLLHKASFIAWIAVTALHVVGHLPEMSRLLGVRAAVLYLPGIRTDLKAAEPARARLGESPLHGARPATGERPLVARGGAGRAAGIGLSVLAGLGLALALIPDYHLWTAVHGLLHHHDLAR